MAVTKYRNTPLTVGAEKYRSKREAERHQELQLMMFAGEISELKREVPFVLAPGVKFDGDKRAKPSLRYFADFSYLDRNGDLVVEDVKSPATRTVAYKIKRHILKANFGIEVREC